MTRTTAAAVGARAAALAMAACSSSGRDPTPGSCVGTMQEPLINGSAGETYLGLGAAQRRAIVEVVNGDDWLADAATSGGLCSAAFVASTWVVTAKHCLVIESPAVIVQGEAPEAPEMLRVQAQTAHPTEDVALLRVELPDSDASDASTSSFEPFVPGGPSVGALRAGDVAELGGYGLTATHGVGSLQFLVESIVQVTSDAVTVSGFGLSGACLGDSGGPLLFRDAHGAVTIAAVLSDGSSTCREEDHYVRLDAIQSWIDETLGRPLADLAEEGCGAITTQGRCLYGDAMWCEGGALKTQACGGGMSCGWDDRDRAFRCVEPSLDPCDGVDSVGACRGGAALSCYEGRPVKAVCGSCATCRVDGRTGGPLCVTSSVDP